MYQNLTSNISKSRPHRYLCPFRSDRGRWIRKWNENRNWK